MMKRILLLLVSVLFLLPVCGQSVVYPVHASVNVVPPYSLYLSDYVSGSRDRLVVTLLNRDVQYQSMPVRLRLTIKGSGFTMQTRPYASLPRITLEPNVPYKLTVDDLLPYFDTRNLSSQGLGGDSYLKGGRLPEGMIEFGIEVLEYGTSKVLSQKSAGTAWLSLQKPPVLSLPFNEEVVPWREPLNLMFQWTPQHSGVARVEYELIIKELWDNGLAPESAFAYSPEVFRERISSTSYLYGVQSPPLDPGRRYAWAVRVVAKDGADDVNIFENDGLSMVRSFRIARYCPEPTQVKARAERGYIQVDWEGSPEHIDYTVAYRIKGSEEWAEVRSSFPSAMLSGVRGGNTYEYRVAGFCEAGIPTFGSIATLTLPSEDTTRLRNCGVLRPVDLSNQEPLEELLSGDQFIAGDFPVHVQEVTGSQGFFTGYGYVHVPFLAFAPFKVTFDNVFINTDRRLIRGVVKTVYDPGESGMSNMNDIFTGGANTGKVVEGITKTDLSADFAIDPNNDFYYDESSGRIEMTDKGGNVIGYIEAGSMVAGGDASGGNSGNESSVFPMTVRDSTGNLYQVEEVAVDETGDVGSTDTGTDASGSKKKLVVKPLGKSGDGIGSDEVNFKRLDSHIAEVEFTDTEGSQYAFDSWKDVYKKSFLIRPKYEQIGEDYHVAAKLVPSGKTDRVGAVIKIRDASVDPLKVVFKTRGGTEFQREGYDAGSGKYVLSVVGGKANDGQELYALYPKKEGGYYNLGKLLIVSYPAYRIRVKVVPVANELDDFDALRAKLQGIYRRVGIDCEVEKTAVFEYNAPLLFQQKSGLLSAYNAEMKKLNEAYSARNTIDRDASYLFILLYNGQGGDRNYTGYMPLDNQFGYLFRRDFDSFDAFAVAAAHELAHGRLSLRHPFDKSLGLAEGDLAENLMDYRNGTELAKWQWDVIHDPGVVIRVFERDKDAMIKGAFYDGIALTPLVDYRYHYNFGDIYSVESQSGDLRCGRYSLTAHYNTDHDDSKKLSYYLVWREVLKDGTRQYRNDYYVGASRLIEFQNNVDKYESAADVFFMNGVPPENMLQVLSGIEIGDMSEVLGGLGDMWGDALQDPLWWINIVNGSVSPKFLKPAGKFMGGFIRGLGDGTIGLLNKCGRLGYKIKHVAGEVALYTNLEIEIARFNSRGVLRPLHWGEAVGEKVLSLEDDVRFLKDGKEFVGKLKIYKSQGKFFWNWDNEILQKYRVAIYDDIKIIAKDNTLPKYIQETFLDEFYYTAEIIKPIKVYRRFGGGPNQAKLLGSFASTTTTLSRSDLAVLKKWSNMQFEVEIIVEKGTKLNLGKIAPQQGYQGGADQILLPLNYPRSWISSIIDLKTKKIYTLEEFEIKFPDQIK